MTLVEPADCGIFLWADMPPAIDIDELVRDAYDAGILLAKGQLFFASDTRSSHLRFNVATCADARVIDYLSTKLKAAHDSAAALKALSHS